MSRETTIINLNREYPSLIQQKFFAILDVKSSWGKYEIQAAYLTAAKEAAEETLANLVASDTPF